MPLDTIDFDTGPSTLPDVGTLSYNGCVFSPLFETKVSGTVVKDEANRTTKYMEYTITVDGYATSYNAVDVNMVPLRDQLTVCGGQLEYSGRGCDIIVNGAGNIQDVAWGPVPELLEFQPLGGGLSAKVRWQVKTRIPEIRRPVAAELLGFANLLTMLQFNYETSVTYSEDGFSSLSVKGTLEIPLTRTPAQTTRTLTYTADLLRSQIETRIMSGIDLSRFHMVKRDFNISRDKRTLTWNFQADEKPYMDLPPNCTIARGTYSVRPATTGMGLCKWLCNLRVTYTVRADGPRRVAWLAFLTLLRLRMAQSVLGNVQPNVNANALKQRIAALDVRIARVTVALGAIHAAHLIAYRNILASQNKPVANADKAWLIDFSFEEGIHFDSKTTTFNATWRLTTTFESILLASGIWKKVSENVEALIDQNNPSGNLWAFTMRDISGAQSWLQNKLDPKLDVIVDFGS